MLFNVLGHIYCWLQGCIAHSFNCWRMWNRGSDWRNRLEEKERCRSKEKEAETSFR